MSLGIWKAPDAFPSAFIVALMMGTGPPDIQSSVEMILESPLVWLENQILEAYPYIPENSHFEPKKWRWMEDDFFFRGFGHFSGASC